MEIYEENGIRYLIGRNIVTVLGFSADGFTEDLIIPASIKNKPVKYIKEEAFKSTNIRSLKFPNTITCIERCAFADCHELQSVCNYCTSRTPKKPSVHDWITLGSYAFNYCVKLQSVEFTYDSIYLDVGVFKNCLSLSDLNAILWEIRKESFFNCLSLKKISLRDSAYIYSGSIEKSGIQQLIFDGNAKMPQKIENYIQKHNIIVMCRSGSNLLDLVYRGINLELLK